MSHTIPSALLTKMQSAAHTEAKLVKLVLADASVIGITSWDRDDLPCDIDGDGDVTYYRDKIASLSPISTQINAPADDLELTVMDDGATFSASLLRSNAFDGAVATVALVDPDDLANPVVVGTYDVGQTQVNGASLAIELIGIEKRLEQVVGVTLTSNCRHRFGDLATCGINTDVSAWQASHAYAVGDEVKPTAANAAGWFRATVAGTSAGTQPTWPGSGTVVDGTVTWTFFKARRRTGTVATVTDKRQFSASGIANGSDYFGEGNIVWLTGANAGTRFRVRSDSGAGALVLQIPTLKTIVAGDTFTAIAGCRHRLAEDCIAKHEQPASSQTRTLRYGGFPHLAPEDVTAVADSEREDDD